MADRQEFESQLCHLLGLSRPLLSPQMSDADSDPCFPEAGPMDARLERPPFLSTSGRPIRVRVRVGAGSPAPHATPRTEQAGPTLP